MEPGAFSASLAVKDIQASRVFYERPGFAPFAGDAAQNWLIMKNGAESFIVIDPDGNPILVDQHV